MLSKDVAAYEKKRILLNDFQSRLGRCKSNIFQNSFFIFYMFLMLEIEHLKYLI